MDIALKYIALLVLVSLVQSKEIIRDSKFVKVNENIIYDCVDIYKQPSLSHPMLKNHKIQMEPSFAIPKSKREIQTKMLEKIIICPNETVPIMRNTKKHAEYFVKNHFHPLVVERPGAHIAGVILRGQGTYHGVAARMSVHDLIISSEQASYACIYVGGGVNNTINFIQTGWMVNPSIFGDGGTWSYGYWQGAKRGGCYNTMCPGFVQVSKTDPLSRLLPEAPEEQRYFNVTIQQDKVTGNWWAMHGTAIHVGYWPKELFDVIGSGANTVGVGGEVQASPHAKSPPMGNGHLPTKNEFKSARLTDIFIMDSNFNFKKSDKFKLEKLLDNDKCYGLNNGRKFTFTYGGPGGDSCGI